jgi:hypothetical protein
MRRSTIVWLTTPPDEDVGTDAPMKYVPGVTEYVGPVEGSAFPVSGTTVD